MRLFNSRSALHSAERNLVHSRDVLREDYRQVRSVLRSRAGHPLTLLIVAGSGTLFVAWLTRRFRKRVFEEARTTAPEPIPALVTALLIRVGLQCLAGSWPHPQTAAPASESGANQ